MIYCKKINISLFFILLRYSCMFLLYNKNIMYGLSFSFIFVFDFLLLLMIYFLDKKNIIFNLIIYLIIYCFYYAFFVHKDGYSDFFAILVLYSFVSMSIFTPIISSIAVSRFVFILYNRVIFVFTLALLVCVFVINFSAVLLSVYDFEYYPSLFFYFNEQIRYFFYITLFIYILFSAKSLIRNL